MAHLTGWGALRFSPPPSPIAMWLRSVVIDPCTETRNIAMSAPPPTRTSCYARITTEVPNMTTTSPAKPWGLTRTTPHLPLEPLPWAATRLDPVTQLTVFLDEHARRERPGAETPFGGDPWGLGTDGRRHLPRAAAGPFVMPPGNPVRNCWWRWTLRTLGEVHGYGPQREQRSDQENTVFGRSSSSPST
ncbi:putative ATP-grasp-modified RiPP [Nonomuraea fuscirosea]|uniref:putative ATP-grasp-modified RiPP n=2 Tax=Nonomuraea fuscirosea TaxID=1291556 RepID=UPI0037200081